MRVWVDIQSGTWGVEDDDNPSIYTLEMDELELELFQDYSDSMRIALATGTGVPLRMLGCRMP